MKKYNNYKTYNLVAALFVSAFVSACGDGLDDDYMTPYQDGNYAGCQVPQAYKDKTVVGSFGDGGTLTLDLFIEGGNQVAAVGTLAIPSIESLFGTDQGQFGQPTPPPGGYGYTGANTPFTTCVATNGFTGTIDDNSIVQTLNLTLQGPGGLFIQMGNLIGYYPMAIHGDSLEGTIKMQIPGWPQTFQILSHP